MFIINTEVHREQDEDASRRLRAANKPLTTICGDEEAPLVIELDHDKVINIQAKAELYSEVLTIVVDDKGIKVKTQDVQRRPYKLKLQHTDFVRA